MKLTHWIVASTIALTSFGSALATTADSALEGVWAEDVCKSAKIKPYRKQEFWGFEASIVQAINSMVYFASDDRRCEEKPVFAINTYYEYNVHEMEEEGYTDLNLVIERITFQTDSEELAKQLRKEKACGLKNWTTGHEFDISTRKCFGQRFREPLDRLYGEYKLNDDLNLVMTKKFKKKKKERSKGKKQTFVKIEDRS